MKTFTILSTGKIIKGIRTNQGEVDKYVQLSTDTTSKFAKAYLLRGNPPDTVRVRIGGVFQEIIYDAYYAIYEGYLLFTRPKKHERDDLYLILLKKEKLKRVKGIVEIHYHKDDLRYLILVAQRGAEFQIFSNEENEWINVTVTEP